MRSGMIAVLLISAITFMTGIAAAIAEDIAINPPDEPININVGQPLHIFPPVTVTYTNWIPGSSTYEITVIRDSDGALVCGPYTGTISTSLETVPLNPPACIITEKVPHTILANGSCPEGGCNDLKRSTHLSINAGINPVPEVATVALVGAGMLGMIGLVRTRRRE